MKLRIVDGPNQHPHQQTSLISYVINDTLAIDAGALGLLPPDSQKSIKHVFVSHSHMDHIATLPLFIDNTYSPGPDCVQVYASKQTLRDLREHVFNDRIWPDLERLARNESSFANFREIEAGQQIEISTDTVVKAFRVDHTVPTVGHVVEHQDKAVAIVADTAPCDAIWEFLNMIKNLKAVFLEISFPNSLARLAPQAKHLTPNSFAEEIGKLKQNVAWFYTHTKPEFQVSINMEVEALCLDRCEAAMASVDYYF